MRYVRTITRTAIRFGPIGIIVGAVLALFGAAPFIAGDPLAISALDRLAPPSERYVMGTDALGRDLASRIVWGARRTVASALAAVAVAAAVGVPVGLRAARRATPGLLAGLLGSALAFPGFLLVLLFAATLASPRYRVPDGLCMTAHAACCRAPSPRRR